ncbi:MAG: VacJ family lipoprotein [Methylococcales bacterium]|nr:VacJ family lipoprotein [Methylococcales bacterium]
MTVVFFAANAGAEEQQAEEEAVASGKPEVKSDVDPYEGFNRAMFEFNDYLDDYVAKPISDAYLWAAPSFLKTGVTNFFSNLKDISVILNDHMQGKFEQGAEDTGRLLANSSLGLLGFVDVATDLGLKKHEEDFGQTLAVWGVPQGSYLVLPILGPTTARGLPGGVVDAAANPSFYVGMPVQLVSMLNTRANAEGALKFINEAAIDPYVFTREAYLQNQQHLISDGKISATVNVLPLEDEIFDDEDAGKTTKPNSAGKSVQPAANNGSSTLNKSLDSAVTALDQASVSLQETDQKLEKLKKARSRKARKSK